jgi:hypothetical protein
MIWLLSRISQGISVSVRSCFINLWSRLPQWLGHLPWPGGHRHQEPLRDAEEGECRARGPTRRRALLVGISYHDSTSPIWVPLYGPHDDVEIFREFLIRVYFIHRSVGFAWPLIPIPDTYGYSPEDIVVLKDDPSLPNHLQPTRLNMVESYFLCSGA